jgi:hypothetical protein
MYRPRRCRVFQLSDRPYNPAPDRNSRVVPVRGEFLAPSLALRFSGATWLASDQHEMPSPVDVPGLVEIVGEPDLFAASIG